MSMLALGLIGVIIGAAGSEILRAARPEFIEKIEDSAKRFAEGFSLSESDEEKPNETE